MFQNKQLNVWESISDLMTGLMIIFLFTGLAFLLQLELQRGNAATIKNQLYEDMKKVFTEEELKRWGAEIDPKTMAVTFKEPDVLFDLDKSDLKPRFQEILSSFFPRYIGVLLRPEYKDQISEIRVEGYASLDPGVNPDLDAAYFYNMKLSQDRARNVLQYVFGIPELTSQRQWMRTTIITNGYSFGKISGDLAYDRRVEFRVMTKAEQELPKNG